MIGKIQRLPLREVWRHEAHDFTTWLQDNLDVLSDVLDLNLTNAEREQSAGAFSVDLVAEDEAGDPVVIENQLGRSDHDHLGKLITYLSMFGAKTAVWIVADPRPEHVRAVAWLNESSSASFYLLKVEAIGIGDSLPAPLLTEIVGPSEEAREVGVIKQDLAERHHVRRRFWSGLLDHAKEKTRLHANISPTQEGWVGAGAGRSGLSYNYVAMQREMRVELYIDRGKDAEEENKAIFDELQASREAIEEAFGGRLEWERLEGKRASQIAKRLNAGGYQDEARWPEVNGATVDAMIRLERALRPAVSRLRAL